MNTARPVSGPAKTAPNPDDFAALGRIYNTLDIPPAPAGDTRTMVNIEMCPPKASSPLGECRAEAGPCPHKM